MYVYVLYQLYQYLKKHYSIDVGNTHKYTYSEYLRIHTVGRCFS